MVVEKVLILWWTFSTDRPHAPRHFLSLNQYTTRHEQTSNAEEDERGGKTSKQKLMKSVTRFTYLLLTRQEPALWEDGKYIKSRTGSEEMEMGTSLRILATCLLDGCRCHFYSLMVSVDGVVHFTSEARNRWGGRWSSLFFGGRESGTETGDKKGMEEREMICRTLREKKVGGI